MDNPQHAQEPWHVGSKVGRAIYGADDSVVAMCDSMGETVSDEANARRIVASVNACAGLCTEELESAPGYKAAIQGFHEQRELLVTSRNQRDQLLEAAEAAYELLKIIHDETGKVGLQLHAAIVAVKGATPC